MENSGQEDSNQNGSKEQGYKRHLEEKQRDTRWIFVLKAFGIFLAVYILRDYIAAIELYLLLAAPFLVGLFFWFKYVLTGDSVLITLKDYITFIPLTYNLHLQ